MTTLRAICIAAASALTLLTAPAFAQDASSDANATAPASDGLTLNLGPTLPNGELNTLLAQSNSGLTIPAVSVIDLPVNAVGSTLFKLDLSDPGCLTGSDVCASRQDRTAFGLSRYITAKKDDGIDLVLRPRASFSFDNDSSSALVGAVVEIGEDLRRGSDFKTNTWYLFAGADAEALTYSPDGLRQLSSGQFHLQDRIIVGDAQAGLGYRIGDADVSLSYLRREATAEGFSYNEDAAALSFTWKR
jgi:hypothetical protein